jgi:hypothetical protein
MAPKVTKAKQVTGPLQALVSRIEHLRDLLCNLPSSLQSNPLHSLYNFSIDPDVLKDGGYFSAFETHLLHVQGRTIIFMEHGVQLEALVKFIKTGVKHMLPGNRTVFEEAWLEPLITAAVENPAQKTQGCGRGHPSN